MGENTAPRRWYLVVDSALKFLKSYPGRKYGRGSVFRAVVAAILNMRLIL